MGKSRILVLQLKEILLTLGLIVLGIFIILLVIFIIKSDDDKKEAQTTLSKDQSLYIPGKYSKEFSLNDTVITMEITVDENIIKDITISSKDENLNNVYPLLNSSLEDIKKQLKEGVPLNEIKISNESKYTKQLLINTINYVLQDAKK